jgi:hypothetical protein
MEIVRAGPVRGERVHAVRKRIQMDRDERVRTGLAREHRRIVSASGSAVVRVITTRAPRPSRIVFRR